jgi:hypothetical protein
MQVVKLAIATLGSQVLLPADATNGLLVQVSNASLPSAITSVVPGTGATNLGKAEDAVAASGDVGVMALAVQRSTAVADGADGDYTPLHTDALGKLWTAGVQTEDAGATSGDRGTFMLAVRRDTATSGAAAGDYHEIEVDATGGLWIAGSQIEDVAATSGDRGIFMLAVRRDAATSGGAAGDYHEMQVDATGYLRTIDKLSEVALSSSTTTALDDDGPIVKASAGTLYGFQGYADAAGFIQVHNKATAPVNPNVPIIVIPIAAGAAFSLDLGMRGRAFSTGIVFGFSSTGPTYTNGGSHLWVDAQFV